MIEEYIYENYSIDFQEEYSTQNDAYYFIFNNNREIYLTKDGKIPCCHEEDLKMDFDFKLYIGTFKNKEVLITNTDCTDNFHTLFELYDLNHEEYQMAARAVLIRDWYKSHQYCGNCGTRTTIDKKDMMPIVHIWTKKISNLFLRRKRVKK